SAGPRRLHAYAPVAGSMVPKYSRAPMSRTWTMLPRWRTTRWKSISSVMPPKRLTECTFQVPLMSVQGTIGVPPVQAPALQVCPLVQAAASHAVPSVDGVHTDGVPAHVQHGSTWQS